MAASTEEFESLLRLVDVFIKKLQLAGKESDKVFDNLQGGSSLKDIQKAEAEIDNLTVSTKELEKQKKQLINLNEKLAASRSKDAKQIASKREQIRKQNLAIKQSVKIDNEKEGSLNKLRAKLADAKRQFDNLSKAERENIKVGGRLKASINSLDREVREIEESTGRFQRNVGKYPKIFGQFSGAVLGGLGAVTGLVAGFRDGIMRAKEFEQGNANLAAVLGKSRGEITALTEDAKRLGAQTSFSASQVSQLQTEFAKLGFNENEILNATEATLDLAAATGSELGEAAAIAGATLGGFGLDAKETSRVTDVMAKSFSTSALDMEKFKESMKDAAPAAKAVGIDVEKTTALLGTLSNAGISGSKAGTALKTSFIKLNAAGLTLEQGLEKVKNSEDKLSAATELVGKNAATSFLVLSEGTDEIDKLEKGLRNAGGAAEKMANEQLDTLEGSLKILDSAWEGFVLSLLSGEGAFSSLSRGMVNFATNILGFLTAQENAEKQSFETAKAMQQEANESQNLLDEYETLTKEGIEPTKEEKERLDEITLQLKDRLGESVVAINEETGAFELNTEAVREQIRAKRLASDEEAIQIASRLKGNKQRIEEIKEEIEANKVNIETRKRLAEEDKKARKERESGGLGGGILGGSTTSTIKQTDAEKNLTNALAEQFKLKQELKTQEEEAIEREERLKELNFDLNDVNNLFNDTTEDQTEILDKNTEAVGNNSKAKNDSFKIFVANQKRRNELIQDEEEKAVAKEKLRFQQEKISAKENNEDLELVELVHQQNLRDIRAKFETERREIEIENVERRRKLNTTGGDEALKRAEDLGKKLEDERKAQLKKEREQIEAAADIAEGIFDRQSNAKIKALDKEEDALKNQISNLEDLSAQGNENATKSLAAAQKKQLEITRAKEQELKKQAQLEIILSGIKTYAAKVEAGDPNPFVSTVTDSALLIEALKNIPLGFKEGGYTGDVGTNDVAGVTHGQEFVLDAKKTSELGLKGKSMADFNRMQENGLLSQPKITEPEQIRFESNEAIIEKYDKMIEVLTKLPRKIEGTGYYDSNINHTLESIDKSLRNSSNNKPSVFD